MTNKAGKTSAQRTARALQKLVFEETSVRPSYQRCLNMVLASAPASGESRELRAARIFESNRAAFEREQLSS